MSEKIGWERLFNSDEAVEYIGNRYGKTYDMLHSTEFGHFNILSEVQKSKILAPFESLKGRELVYTIIPKQEPIENHYDFYVGESDDAQTMKGYGAYCWEPEKDDDGDTVFKVFIGVFKDGQPTADGVEYIFSNEDAKNSFRVMRDFYVTATEDAVSLKESNAKYIILVMLPSLCFILSLVVGIYVKWWAGIIILIAGAVVLNFLHKAGIEWKEDRNK